MHAGRILQHWDYSTGVKSFVIVISLKHTCTYSAKTTKLMLNQSHASAKTGLL